METISLKEYVERRFDDSDKAVQAALVSQEKAILKAENAAEERFKLLNELRSGVATKDEVRALEKIVEDLKTSRDRGTGIGAGVIYLFGGLAAFATILAIINFFTKQGS